MTLRRFLLGALAVGGALLLQGTVIARLPLPGAAPDLVLVVVVAFALAEGPLSGMVTGFVAGLLADLGSDHELGRIALVLTLVGYVAGLLADEAGRSRALPFGAVALAAAGGISLYAAEGVLLGDPRITGAALIRSLLGTVPYCVLLTPLVVPLIGSLVLRVDRDLLRR